MVEGQKVVESVQVDNYHYSRHHYHYHYNDVVKGHKKSTSTRCVMVSENVIVPTLNLDDYELMIVS